MNIYKQYDLGEAGVQYVITCLQNGNRLSHHVLRSFELAGSGYVSTFMPCDVRTDYLEKFKCGGVACPQRTLEYIVEAIQNFLSNDPGHIVIFEDATARKDDPYTKNSRADMFFYNDEVYYYLLEDKSDTPIVVRTITEAESPHLFVGVMAAISNNSPRIPPHNVPDAVLQNYALNTNAIIVGAYDGEGYLLWHRRT